MAAAPLQATCHTAGPGPESAVPRNGPPATTVCVLSSAILCADIDAGKQDVLLRSPFLYRKSLSHPEDRRASPPAERKQMHEPAACPLSCH